MEKATILAKKCHGHREHEDLSIMTRSQLMQIRNDLFGLSDDPASPHIEPEE